MTRLLVTGGAGFIGSHLVDALINKGREVVVLDNEATGDPSNVNPAAEYYKIDVRDAEALRGVFSTGIEAVFHVAGQASTVRSFSDPTYDFAVNFGGTVNVVDACVHAGVPRLVFASSMTVYGHPASLPVSESEPPVPISYYGISKYAAERYVLATSERHDLRGRFNATAFRMFNVFGPRQSLDNPYQGVMAIFMSNLLQDKEVKIFGDGLQTRDFVFIDDVVRAWLGALSCPVTIGKAYNIGSGSALSMVDLVRKLQIVMEKQDAKVNHYDARVGDQRHMAADISSVCRDLGWRPTVGFERGIARTLEWAKESMSD